jgi:required for meiotic nuclear division protein 1
MAPCDTQTTLAHMFELPQRYHQVQHKSETLMDISEVFTSLSHASTSTRLEWTIIVLIVIVIEIEIVIGLIQIR